MNASLLELASDLTCAYLRKHASSTDEVQHTLGVIARSLMACTEEHVKIPERRETAPASWQQDTVLCLECGREFQLLSNRHLARHDLTPRDYKLKHRIKLTQPLSSKTLTAKRRRIARRRGMGKELAEWRHTRQQNLRRP